METSIFTLLLIQVFLIALNAIFAAAEIAVISLNDAKLASLAAKGNRKAARLARLTSQPARFLATIQVAITLSGFLGSAFAADNFSDILVDWVLGFGVHIPRESLNALAVILITLILSYFTLIFGELVPKRVAMRKSESLALGISGLISIISKLFAPIVWLLTISTNAVLRLLGIDPNAEDEEIGEEEIRMMVDTSSEKGRIAPEEQQLIQNIFEFDDTTASEIAVHRTDVSILWMDDSMDVWDEEIRRGNRTRYPICEDSIDNIIGVLNTKRYFRLEQHDRDTIMREAVLAPYFVPENIKADVLFKNMKEEHHPLAVLLNEYGGVTGIVTMNDLLQALVGDFEPYMQSQETTPSIIPLNDDHYERWSINGSAPIKDVNKILNIQLDAQGCETFGGYVFTLIGIVPESTDTPIHLSTDLLDIEVKQIKSRQIQQTIVTKRHPQNEDTNENND